mgnify:CR=1 FL=1
MTEAKYQKKLIDQYTAQGWFVIKLIKTNLNGIPDLLCLKAGHEPKFIEVKAENGTVSKLQEYRIKQLKELGFDAEVKRYEKTK